MSTAAKAASGANEDPSGIDEDKKTDNPTDSGAKDSVKFETYQRVLDQKKKRDQELADAKERLQVLEDEKKSQEEVRLKEKEDFKKLAERRENELKEERDKRAKLEKNLQDGRKLRSLLESVQGTVPQQYWSLFDLEKVAVDSDTNEPDEESVKSVAKEFEARYPDVIKRKSNGSLPKDAAKGSAGTKITYEAWMKLPLDEQKKRMKDVDQSTF